MEWLEIIKVRATGTGDQGIDTRFLEQVERVLNAPGLADARMYAHASVPNDLVVTLTWVTPPPRPVGSDLANSLIQEFRKYGLVDHSVWVERI